VPDRSYIEQNDRERERLRVLIASLSDDDLRTKVNEFWTVAGVLGHLAYWDARAEILIKKAQRGEAFTASDYEPDDPTWINDSTRALIHAIPPRGVAELTVRTAEDIDARVTEIPADKLWPNDPESPLNGRRASHRGEHLDEIEAAVGPAR